MLHWFVIEIVVATSYVPERLFAALLTTLILLMVLPFLDQALGAAIVAAFTGDQAVSAVLKATNEQTGRGMLRIARVAGGIVLVLLILAVWRIDLVAVAERGVGAQFGADLVGALVIASIAYIAWEAIRVIVDRQTVRSP